MSDGWRHSNDRYFKAPIAVPKPITTALPARPGSPVDLLGKKLSKALRVATDLKGFYVVSRQGHLALVDIGVTVEDVPRAQREALIEAIGEVWGEYSYQERQGLGYEVTLGGKLLSRCA